MITKFRVLSAIIFSSSMILSDNNLETINSYEESVQKYIDKTPKTVDGSFKDWIMKFLSFVSKDKPIFEIGSAFGRDANFIESLDYKVIRSDATVSFVRYLENSGFECRYFNLLTDDFKEPLYVLFANAVFLHFTREELNLVLNKIYSNLEPNGILVFSVKAGVGEGWSYEKLGKKRYFYYWQLADLKNLLINCGYEILFLEQDYEKKWIYVIAKKVTYERTPSSN